MSVIETSTRPNSAAQGAEKGRRLNHDLDVVTLQLGTESFALPADRVVEVLELLPVTPVPNASAFAPGLVNVRGRVLPVVNIHQRFGLIQAEPTRETRIVVVSVRYEGEDLTVAMVADAVHTVTHMQSAAMDDAPDLGVRWRAEFCHGVGKTEGGFVVIADIDRLVGGGTDTNNEDAS